MDHYIIMSLGQALSMSVYRMIIRFSTSRQFSKFVQPNHKMKRAILAIVELILKITLQEHLYLHLILHLES